MRKQSVALCLIVGLALGGCQSWQLEKSINALSASSSERKIVKEAQNDPFPSPEQVGLK